MHRLLATTIAATLVLAAPAGAVEWSVDVRDFDFTPEERTIEVGDTILWRFHDGGHTATSDSGQSESWDSGEKPGGSLYRHTFTRPGRFTYVCVPHADYPMRGVIVVGGDPVPDTVDNFTTKRRGHSVRIGFDLNEAAKMTYKLRGPSKRTVKRARLEAGHHSFRVKRLARGRYRGTLTLEDDFGKRVRPRNSFRIR